MDVRGFSGFVLGPRWDFGKLDFVFESGLTKGFGVPETGVHLITGSTAVFDNPGLGFQCI